MRLSPPIASRLADQDTERVRREHHDKIVELQGLPASSLTVVPGVSLANATPTTIAHKLGRAPNWLGVSVPRGATSAGYIVETRDSTHDRAEVVVLTATGYGATITVDLVVL